MQWTVGRPFVPLVDQLDRVRLRRAATEYIRHGWPVTPGAWLTGHRFTCGRPGCPIMTCHPALESWERPLDSPRTWWRHHPQSVLLVTGGAFDALEVPAFLGLRVLGTTRLHRGVVDASGPVAVTAGGRWMFLVRPGVPLRSEVDHRLDVIRHGEGSWIPAPPSRLLEGRVRWAVTPQECGWRLPDADVVQGLLVDALGSARAPQPTVPRQLSAARLDH
nr:bifunctional DNA primase/polymerase [uncultured Actinoplanes sp.]